MQLIAVVANQIAVMPWHARYRQQSYVFVVAAMTDPLSLQQHVCGNGWLTSAHIEEAKRCAHGFLVADERTAGALARALSQFVLEPSPDTLEEVREAHRGIVAIPSPAHEPDREWYLFMDNLAQSCLLIAHGLASNRDHRDRSMLTWTGGRDRGQHLPVVTHLVRVFESIVSTVPALSDTDPRYLGSAGEYRRTFRRFMDLRTYISGRTSAGIPLSAPFVCDAFIYLRDALKHWAGHILAVRDMDRRLRKREFVYATARHLPVTYLPELVARYAGVED